MQTMDKARKLYGVDVLAVIAIVVDGITLGKVDLEHRTEALHDGGHVSPPENIAQPSDGGIADREQLDVSVFCAQQVQIGGYNVHGEAVSIKSPIVQHHVVRPAHPIENGARSRHGAD